MATRKTLFGQVVIGPPGSGKTTYCNAMQEFLKHQNRTVTLVNLDPANENIPYQPAIDISKLITLEDVMVNLSLGPNGGLIYCMEFLEKNVDWLFTEIKKFQDTYFIFDFPGQVELYTHHNSVRNIFKKLEQLGFRLCCIHLVDSHYCSDAGKFISVLLTTLSTMLQIELPQVNVLSKMDLAEQYGKLQFGLDFYTDVLDLNYLLETLDTDPFMKKYRKLNSSIIDVLENYSLVSFIPLSIKDPKSIQNVQAAIDKANGYIFGPGEQRNAYALFSSAIGAQFEHDRSSVYGERYIQEDDGMSDM